MAIITSVQMQPVGRFGGVCLVMLINASLMFDWFENGNQVAWMQMSACPEAHIHIHTGEKTLLV